MGRGKAEQQEFDLDTLDLTAKTKSIHDWSMKQWAKTSEAKAILARPPAWWTLLKMDSISSVARNIIMNVNDWDSDDVEVRRKRAAAFFKIFDGVTNGQQGWSLDDKFFTEEFATEVYNLQTAIALGESKKWCVASPPECAPDAAVALQDLVDLIGKKLSRAEAERQEVYDKELVLAHHQAMKDKVALLTQASAYPADYGNLMHAVKRIEEGKSEALCAMQADAAPLLGVEKSSEDILREYQARDKYITEYLPAHEEAMKRRHREDEVGRSLRDKEQKEQEEEKARKEAAEKEKEKAMEEASAHGINPRQSKRPNLGPRPAQSVVGNSRPLQARQVNAAAPANATPATAMDAQNARQVTPATAAAAMPPPPARAAVSPSAQPSNVSLSGGVTGAEYTQGNNAGRGRLHCNNPAYSQS